MSNITLAEISDRVLQSARAEGSGVFNILRLLHLESGQRRPVQGKPNGCSSFLEPEAFPIRPIAE